MLSPSDLTPADLAYAEAMRAERPRTRGDCADGPRPCPWVSCRHHLASEIDPRTGRIDRLVDPTTIAESCSLDVADRGGASYAEVGRALGVTRERVRQLEARALARSRRGAGYRLRVFHEEED